MKEFIHISPFIAILLILAYYYSNRLYDFFDIHETRKQRRLFKNLLFAILPLVAIKIKLKFNIIYSKIEEYSLSVTLNEFIQDLNKFSDLIVAFSTIILVISTIVYVFYTKKILKETKDAKLIEIRPIINVSLDSKTQNEKGEIEGVISIQNFSKSFIIDCYMKFEDAKDNFNSIIHLDNGPSFRVDKIQPLEVIKIKFSSLEYSHSEFSSQLKIEYYDVQRNKYEYIGYYSNDFNSIRLKTDQEVLFMTPFNKIQSGIFTNSKKIIFQRRTKTYGLETWEIEEFNKNKNEKD